MNRGVYIHIPFCTRKCAYCDFYSVTDLSLTDKYTDAVIRNIRAVKSDNYTADTVYFGGGTPSLLSAIQIERILTELPLAKDAEISMECNPDSVKHEYLRDVKNAGINRVSFGVQSFNDNELSRLGRLHNSKRAAAAISEAYDVGFENISADLMLAVPYQTLSSLNENLKIISSLPLKHISAYMLKIEHGTPLYDNNELINAVPNDDDMADYYLEAVNKLNKFGMEQYEISNFSHNGYECRHNLKYWNCEEYYGFGPSAHSYINDKRYSCNMNVSEYTKSPLQTIEITEENAGGFEENAMLNLRLTKTGFDVSKYPEHSNRIIKKAKLYEKNGLLNINGTIITLTTKGCLVSNSIISNLIFE